ncbi:MAG: hypothetical protein KUG79_07510 [Pseudomonadales bacterium]|nr:hypothetical protein [Pseudomonadales bacterium]
MLWGTAKNIYSLIQSEKLTYGKRKDTRSHCLNNLVKHATQYIPMYRDLYSAIDLDKHIGIDQLDCLPLVSKQLLKSSFPDNCTDSRVKKEHLYQVATSGTSDRVMLFQDDYKRDWDRAADLLLKFRTERYGRVLTIPPDDCYERCGLNDQNGNSLYASLKEIFDQDGRIQQEAKQKFIAQLASRSIWKEYLTKAPGVDGTAVAQEVIDKYFDDIDEICPATVRGFPYYFWMMACRSNDRKFTAAKYIRPSGGKATPFMIETIERRLEVRYRENYGTAELGSIAMDSETSRQQTLIESLFVIEFLRNGKSVPQGEIGELVITDLRNHVSPLIRYRVGDVGRVLAQPADNDHSQLKFEVCGRLDETIVNQSNKVFTSDVLIDFFLERGLDFCKLIQVSEGKYLLEIVQDKPVPGNLEADFSQFMGEPVILTVKPVRRIAPEGSGKFKLVVSKSFHKFNGTVHNDTTLTIG